MRTLSSRLIGTLAVLLLAACVGEPERDDPVTPAEAECRAAGGEPMRYGPEPWQVACGAGELALYRAQEARIRAQCDAMGMQTLAGGSDGWYCARATADAGKACTRETDCEGFCMAGAEPSARLGQCSAATVFVGCRPILDPSGERIELCVD